jgi:hypothetical protein
MPNQHSFDRGQDTQQPKSWEQTISARLNDGTFQAFSRPSTWGGKNPRLNHSDKEVVQLRPPARQFAALQDGGFTLK